jgi:hypothetical protein
MLSGGNVHSKKGFIWENTLGEGQLRHGQNGIGWGEGGTSAGRYIEKITIQTAAYQHETESKIHR